MADKYCIASGDYNDTAIWSDTDGGPGGASLPAAADNRIFNASVSVTKFANPTGHMGITTIAAGINTTITIDANATLTQRTFGGSLQSNGSLTVAGDKNLFFTAGSLKNGPGAVLTTTGGNLYVNGARIENRGRIACPAAFPVFVQTTDETVRHAPGKISALTAYIESAGTVRCNIEDAIRSEIGQLTFHSSGSPSTVLARLFTPATVGDLRFFGYSESGMIRFEQYAPLEVSGSILSYIGPVEWISNDNASLSFVGTADQTIAMPSTVTGQTWSVDKPAGKLTLTNFNGYLQGRIRNLIVGIASSIDLSGPSPYLLNSSNDRTYYHGLKADALSTDPAHSNPGAESHGREAMDSCVNSGQITIPGGKVLCTKTFENHTGASVLGEGTLCVRHGGLTNLGTIAPTVTIHYYDRPASIDLSLSPHSGHLPLTVTATVESDFGRLWTFDWGNSHVTGPTESRSAVYTYQEEGNYNVTVTAMDFEGTELCMSCPVTVFSRAPVPQARLSIIPWQGDTPLDVVVSTEGSVGTEMTIDWGDGSPVLGPLAFINGANHRYETPGRFLATLRVWNVSGDVAEATQIVGVTDPTEVRAGLELFPSSGEAPLTILADASTSNGSDFTFNWGDGVVTGPQPESQATHTFDRPGYYSVILTTTKDNLTASTTKGVVVHLASPVPPSTILPSNLGPVEIDPRKISYGIPRGNLPSIYRYALAQGICYMNDTLQLFCPMDQSGRSLHNGSALFLGRITYATGQPIFPTIVESASYTVFRLDDSDPAFRRPVEGHTDVPLEIEKILHTDLIVDENWPFDETGYNFHHVLDDSIHSPFPVPGRNYLISFVLQTDVEPPKIMLQYRVRVH